jgi:phytoene dehydrogenase-like protein
MSVGDYDAIVVGGGHNGLVCGAYFARAGARAVVLEARAKTGGAADTSAPFPDHPEIRVSTYSYVMSLMPRTIIEELELTRFGYDVTPFGPYYQAFPDGRSLQVFAEDHARSRASVARFSKRDAEALPHFEAWLRRVGDVLGPLLTRVPPKLGSLAPGDLLDQARAAWSVRKLGVRGVGDVTRLLTMSVSDLLDEWFESEELKGVLAVNGIIGTWAGPDEPGTAYVMLHHVIGDVGDGHMGSWGFPQGGMGAVADAIRRSAEHFGCEVRTRARAEKILCRDGRALGVALENGDVLRAPVVVSAIHPKTAFLELVERKELPEDFAAAIERWRTRSGVVKINLALSELPDFRADPGTALQEHHTGSILLCFSPRYLERAFQDAHLEGRASASPFAEGTIPTTLDRKLAPPGVHVFSIFSQWVPHPWSREPHREELEAYADRIVRLYGELAPNFERAVIDRQVLGPHHLERELGLVGGNIFHGELSVDQLFHMRPAPGFADYRTPIRGLYHASSATHAGGGVNGIPGWQAFRQARKDRRRLARRWR